MAGAASTAYSLGATGQSGMAGIASGLAGVGKAAGAAAQSPAKKAMNGAADTVKERLQTGARSAFSATGGSSTQGTVAASTESAASAAGGASSPPAWAQRMRRHQAMSHGVTTLAHAVRSGDSGGGGHSVDLSERG
jgi:type IV secretion system protein TrbL